MITLRSKLGEKVAIQTNDQLVKNIQNLLEQINKDLYATAKLRLDENTFTVNKYEDMKKMINDG